MQNFSSKIVQQKFEEAFGPPSHIIDAPGRINIIGEHTDYNDGFVLPASVNKKITFAFAKNNLNGLVRIHALNAADYKEYKLKEASPETGGWLKFVMAVTSMLLEDDQGFDCVFGGDLPIGSGMSSSSALTVGMAAGLDRLFNLQNKPLSLVKKVQEAEAVYTGVRGGIMDQFTIAMGKKDQVLLLDCRSLDYTYYPLSLGKYTLLLCNTNVQHQLANTEYNTRRAECETGVAFMQNKGADIKNLRDVNISMINRFRDEMDPVIFKRCYFVVKENERVLQSCKALQSSDMNILGALLYASHEGLQNEYEVSCDELDFLVDQTRRLPAVLGARMMGGGFGGCTINLVRKNQVNDVIKELSEAYFGRFDRPMDAFVVSVGDGVFFD